MSRPTDLRSYPAMLAMQSLNFIAVPELHESDIRLLVPFDSLEA